MRRLPALLACAALASCDRDPTPQRAGPASLSSVALALGVDAATLELPADPTSPAGDLRADIDRYTTLDACLIEHAPTDPLVGDALHAIGYDTFLRDTCRMLEAMKSRDRSKCATIDAGGLRGRCEATVAMIAESPESCPWSVPETPSSGRDATCVAVASRDARLCRGAPRTDRVTCEALVERSEERCQSRIEVRERAACKRDVQRWRRVVNAPQTGLPPIPAPRARIELRGAEGSTDPLQPETDLTQDVARGLILTEAKEGARFTIGGAEEIGSTNFAPAPGGRVRLALALFAPYASPTSAVIEHAEIAIPGAGVVVVPGARCDCQVKVTSIGRARGDAVHLVVNGTVGVAPHAYVAHAEVTTFVRDVIALPPTPKSPH